VWVSICVSIPCPYTTTVPTMDHDQDAPETQDVGSGAEVWSEIYICSERFNGLATHNGTIALTSEQGRMVGAIRGLRPGHVVAFFQQPMEIFHRAFHNVFYLWVVYESHLDLVYCDAKDGYDIAANMSGRTLSFYRPEYMGVISKFDVRIAP
jgi:hypothetical protein